MPLALLGAILADGPLSAQSTAAGGAADEYFRGYMLKGEAERLEQSGDAQQALTKFRQALDIFDSIAKNYPAWETQMLTYRRQKIHDAITRVENRLAAPPAMFPGNGPASTAAATAPLPATPAQPAAGSPLPASVFGQLASQPPAAGPAAASSAPQLPANGNLPSLSDFLSQWESAYKQRFQQLDQQNKQQEADLLKWQQWYGWASREMQASKETTDALAQRAASLEQAILQAQKEVEAGRATKAQLDALQQQHAATSADLAQARQRLAAASKSAQDASQRLAEASAQLATLQQDRDKAVKERDDALKKADAAGAERDKLAAQSLGWKAELDNLKRTTGSGSNKDLLAKNELLRKELDEARQQIATLKGDITKKDAEIAQLKGQLTSIQGELATLRQQNAAYQTQVTDLTVQLKELQSRMDGKTDVPPQVVAENQMLRSIILRQLRSQARQQQAKALIIAELQKTENASKELLQQVEELGNSRVTLTAEEEKLFTDPQLKEALSESGFQATLMASSNSKPDASASAASGKSTAPNPPPPAASAPGSAAALLDKANELLQDDKLAEAAAVYEETLRADPKNASALIGLGAAKMRAGKYTDAEVALKKCLAYEPENETAQFTLGITYFKAERNKEAMSSFEKSLERRPKNARAHHYLGIIATKMGLLDRAEREFKSALAIDPSYGDANFNLAVLYVSWDPPKWDQARSNYSDALKKGVKPDPNLEKILKGPNPAVSIR